jgi:hypothetical protein
MASCPIPLNHLEIFPAAAIPAFFLQSCGAAKLLVKLADVIGACQITFVFWSPPVFVKTIIKRGRLIKYMCKP